LNAGLVERTDNGRVHFPYDAIHLDSELPPDVRTGADV